MPKNRPRNARKPKRKTMSAELTAKEKELRSAFEAFVKDPTRDGKGTKNERRKTLNAHEKEYKQLWSAENEPKPATP